MTAPLLSLDELRRAVADGSIDTVLACLVDMQGRLMGKRFQGEYFVDSGHEETHCCNYLLANDIDMEPVPGYAAASWTQGYGDFVLKPDLSTLRRVPWLEGTALVLCDVQDHHHHDLPHSPRAILKRQVARLAERALHDRLWQTADEAGDGGQATPWRRLRVEGTVPSGEEQPDEDRFAFSRQILSVVADSFGYEAEDGVVCCWLERRLSGDA